MRSRIVAVAAALAVAGSVSASPRGASADRAGSLPPALGFWPQWRGPLMTGVAPEARPPFEWSETKNVRWKAPIPGKGSATPVVWGDRIFVLTAVPTEKRAPAPAPGQAPPPAVTPPAAAPPPPASAGPGTGPGPGGPPGAGPGGRPRLTVPPEFEQKFVVMALRRSDGKVLWERTVRQALPHEGTHPTGTWASASATTDGERVFAHFGSHGLYALDLEGKLLWEKDLGDMTVKLGFGEGSSPALWRDRLFLQWDHEGESFVVALEAKTGRELWRQRRDEGTSWATPLVVERDGKAQVVTSATNKVRSYDGDTGKLLWEVAGMTANTIPTPVHADGLLFATSGFRGNALLAVDLAKAQGDLTGSPAVVWTTDRDTPYTPSPLLYGGVLYVLKGNNGMLTAFDARSGERLYGPERLEGVPNVYASPLGADGRIYVPGREGATAVVQAGRSFKVVATNTLEDGFDASPLAVGSELYLRGQKFLYRISE